jgi:hypothetical protein
MFLKRILVVKRQIHLGILFQLGGMGFLDQDGVEMAKYIRDLLPSHHPLLLILHRLVETGQDLLQGFQSLLEMRLLLL